MRETRRAFTIVEFMVVFGILIILLSIFIPYLMKLRETDRRTRCADNLHQIYMALAVYAKLNGYNYPRVIYDEKNNPHGYTAFSGADDISPFAERSNVQPNDVTASLWLLVRGWLLQPGVFICPSTNDSRDLMTDANGRTVSPQHRGNFRRPANLSYSYSSPFSNAPGYRMDDSRQGDFALLADKSPGINLARGDDVIGAAWNAPMLELAKANSANHGKAGQNVLFAGGVVRFERTPFCGVGRTRDDRGRILIGGDNIYTALTRLPLNGEKPVANGNGFWGREIGSAWEGDSYLVPTADDAEFAKPPAASQPTSLPLPTPAVSASAPATLPVTMPATTQSTTLPATTIPTTQPILQSAARVATRPATHPTTHP